MNDLSVIFQHVTFAYEGASQPLIRGMSAHFARGWTGIVGANGMGKSTILKLATRMLEPQEGQVVIPESAIYCEQRTDNVPNQLHGLIAATDGEAIKIRHQLGVKDDWLHRWKTLSHGERKRAQIAAALWSNPEVLALDEPSNHLDAAAQELLFEALSSFHTVGLLVSHDRRLLDGLCHQCLFVDSEEILLRPGNYSQGVQEAEKDNLTARRQRSLAAKEFERLKREATDRREEASHADRKRSKRGLALKDHDSRAKINLARVTGKDGVAGKRLSQIEGRLSRARAKADSIKVKKSYELGIWMPGEKSKRNTLFNIPAGSISLGEGRSLDFPDLVMSPDDRIALTGLNGCGKSTLIRHIMESLNLEQRYVTCIPQEIEAGTSQKILAQARELPRERLGRMLTIVGRLGSSPQRLLETPEPTPGEIRKILLATGIAGVPHLIVMDEPTNHLDLPSIECLEEALAGCPCGLLLVSHDRRFLDTLTRRNWHISGDSTSDGRYILKIRQSGNQ